MDSFIIGLQRLDGDKRSIVGTIVNKSKLQLRLPVQKAYSL